MSSPALDPDADSYFGRRRRKRAPQWVGPAALVLIVIGAIAVFVLQGPTIGERQRETRILNVVLPPPPPPPPPPPEQKPPEPVKPVIPTPQPTPQTPPPPTPQAAPQAQAQANDALTARVGAAAGNYGLAAGNGSGVRIGGTAGGNDAAFTAYADFATDEIHRAAQADPALSHGRYRLRIVVQVAPDGRIARVRVIDAAADPRRDKALTRLVGLQLSRRPPEGLPLMRLEFNTRNGA